MALGGGMFSLKMLSIFLPLCVCTMVAEHSFNNWPSEGRAQEIVSMLQTAPILSMRPMRELLLQKGMIADFANQVYVVELQGGLKGVFKPSNGSVSYISDELDPGVAEVAAYKISQFLGFPLVPPTVLRTIQGERGSLQLYVNSLVDAAAPKVYENIISSMSSDERAQLLLYYFVFGQWDYGCLNVLVSQMQGRPILIAIDNAGIANHQHVQYGDLPFVRVWQRDNRSDFDGLTDPFPFDSVQVMYQASHEKLVNLFGAQVPADLCSRITENRRRMVYVFWHGALWVQFYANDDSFIRSYTTHYPAAALEKFAQLNQTIMKTFFDHVPESDQKIVDEYIAGVLARRDQVLAHAQRREQ